MPWRIEKNIRENVPLRESFMELAVKTFSLDFHSWWEKGFWGERYIPYVMTDGSKVVSNISVNVMDMNWDGEERKYIQLGTVMTDTEYRGRGFSRKLMEAVLDEWKDRCDCDAVYLFANDSVLDFYPKFGFKPAKEHQVSVMVSPKEGKLQRLNMSCSSDLQKLFAYYKKGNPYSRFAMADNEGLLAFYCTGFLKENIYFLPDFDAAVVAESDGDTLVCYDIFSDGGERLESILEVLAETKEVLLGFTPTEPIGQPALLKEEDTTLFLLDGKENLFQGNSLMFPLLSHA